MKCSKCGTELDTEVTTAYFKHEACEGVPLHTHERCRDVLAERLAWFRKLHARALERAEAQLTAERTHHNIDRCGWQQTRDALAAERAKREKVEAQLKTAVEALKKCVYRGDVEDGEPLDYDEARNWWNECDSAAREALAASHPPPSESGISPDDADVEDK